MIPNAEEILRIARHTIQLEAEVLINLEKSLSESTDFQDCVEALAGFFTLYITYQRYVIQGR